MVRSRYRTLSVFHHETRGTATPASRNAQAPRTALFCSSNVSTETAAARNDESWSIAPPWPSLPAPPSGLEARWVKASTWPLGAGRSVVVEGRFVRDHPSEANQDPSYLPTTSLRVWLVGSESSSVIAGVRQVFRLRPGPPRESPGTRTVPSSARPPRRRVRATRTSRATRPTAWPPWPAPPSGRRSCGG